MLEKNKEIIFVALSEPINIKNNIYGDIIKELSKRFRIIHVICLGNEGNRIDHKVIFHSFPLQKWPNIFRKFSWKRVCAILITDFFVGGIISRRYATKWNIPLIYRCGGPWKYELNNPIKIIKALILKITKPLVLKSCQQVVYNSKAIVQTEISHHYDIVYNGVDTTLFKPTSMKKRTNKLNVLYIGRMLPEKGLDYLFKAVKGLEGDVHLGLIGDGKLLLRYKEKHPLAEFYGRIPKVEIPKIISQYDLVVLPSLVESFPNVLLEAMACGKPVIATNIFGIPEMIIDGVNGYLVPPKSYQSIKKTILRFVKEPELIITMGKEARRIVEEKFEKEKQMKKLEKALFKHQD